MPLAPQSSVPDVVTEMHGSAPTASFTYTIFNVPNVTSGEIYNKITEANAALQQWTGVGGVTPTDTQAIEAIKRYETNFAAAKLGADIIGVVITDGFNVAAGGISIQRTTAEFNTYQKFIKDHLDLAQWWLKSLHPWFYAGIPSFPEGLDEYGNPIWYWHTSNPGW
jgi:hypothetical protein